MTRWQRRARLVIAICAVVFLAVLAWQLKPRPTPPVSISAPRVDPVAVVEIAGGRTDRFTSSRQDVSLEFKQQFMYSDGSTKLVGVTIVADAKDARGTFTATGKEAKIGQDHTSIELNGDVRLASAEIRARTEHATYAQSDNTVRAPGPVEVTEGRTTARGVGMIFDRERDVLTILDQAVVRMDADETGGGATEITCGSATFARRERLRQFDNAVRIQRGNQTIEAETAVAHLSEGETRIELIELRGGTKITTSKAAPGALQSLTGNDISLKYAADGQALQQVVIGNAASIQVAGEAGQPGREISAGMMDIALARDGSTPTALVARDNVQLSLPQEGATPGRTIRAAALDAKGEAGRGLTRAQFSGKVQYREQTQGPGRAANAETLDVGLKRGLGGIEDARFARAVRFVDGKLTAVAASARWDVDKGTLELSGSEPGATMPRVTTEQIAVDAVKLDVTLEGPKVTAAGNPGQKVKSILQPAKADQKSGDTATKMPSMLKEDQPVNVTATTLEYDGTTSKTSYTGTAMLWQGDTSIKAESIVIDGKTGDLDASAVTSATMLEQTDRKTNKKERVRSLANAKDLKYEDDRRRLTYSGEAHMSSPDGDMTAEKIELYLKPSGDELDRAEAYVDVTLREQNRKTTGTRMTYTTADERYVIVGTPVRIVDQCERETTGKTLTFLKATDSIIVDGNQQARTQTKGGGGKCTS